MALSTRVPSDDRSPRNLAWGAERNGRNDTFSFWKLHEGWRESLEASIGESETAAQLYLFEEYLPDHNRQPPVPMQAYYTFYSTQSRRKPLPLWDAKAQWVEALGGMILTLIHPDYCGDGRNLDDYEDPLKQFNDLPSTVASATFRRCRLVATTPPDETDS